MPEVILNSPPPDPAVAPVQGGKPAHLQGNMGTAQLVLTVLAFNAPIGIVAGVLPLVVGYGTGVGTPLLFLGLGLIMAIFAVGYTLMARKITRAGAFYSFVTSGLGRPLGLAASFVALLSYICGMAGTLPFVGLSLEGVSAMWGAAGIAWWVWVLIFVAVIGILGYLRIDFSARILAFIVAGEVAVVVIYDAVIMATGGATGQLTFSSFNPENLLTGGLAVGTLFGFIAFSGFEATAIFRDEVRAPQRTIPLATYISVGIIAVFYAVASWVLIQAFGESEGIATIATDPSSAFLNSVNQYLGRVAFDIATVLLMTSSLASLTALHNVISRYLFNLGSDGVLPSSLGIPHPRFGSPHRASIAFSVLVAIYVIAAALAEVPALSLYTTMIGLAGYSLMFLFFLASVGIAAYLVKSRPKDATIWHHTVAPVIAVIAMGTVLVNATINIDLLTGSSSLSAFAVGMPVAAVVLGIFLALYLRSRRPTVYAQIGTRE